METFFPFPFFPSREMETFLPFPALHEVLFFPSREMEIWRLLGQQQRVFEVPEHFLTF